METILASEVTALSAVYEIAEPIRSKNSACSVPVRSLANLGKTLQANQKNLDATVKGIGAIVTASREASKASEEAAKAKLAEAKAELSEYRQHPVADETKPPIVIAEEKAEDVTEAITETLRTLVGDRYSVVYIRDNLNREFGRNYTKDDIVKMRSEL